MNIKNKYILIAITSVIILFAYPTKLVWEIKMQQSESANFINGFDSTGKLKINQHFNFDMDYVCITFPYENKVKTQVDSIRSLQEQNLLEIQNWENEYSIVFINEKNINYYKLSRFININEKDYQIEFNRKEENCYFVNDNSLFLLHQKGKILNLDIVD